MMFFLLQGPVTTSDLREDVREDEGNEEDEDDNSTICDEDNDSIGKTDYNSLGFKWQLFPQKIIFACFEKLGTFVSSKGLIGSLG
jgi:hypothetical protein